MSKKKTGVKNAKSATVNRRARYDYHLKDNLTVGMVLSGVMVRAIRDHHVQLKGAFVTIKDGELWLNNLTLGSEIAENIKLLATKKQIAALAREKEKLKNVTIVPVKLHNTARHIKLDIALGVGKKNYDKRESIKQKDLARERERGY